MELLETRLGRKGILCDERFFFDDSQEIGLRNWRTINQPRRCKKMSIFNVDCVTVCWHNICQFSALIMKILNILRMIELVESF